MKTRLAINATVPSLYAAMCELDRKIIEDNHVPMGLLELVKIYVSRLNKCSFCYHMHVNAGLKKGERPERIDALVDPQECKCFDEREKAVLRLAYQMTFIASCGVASDVYDDVYKYYGEKGTGQLIMAIVTINSWNRISIATNR